MLAKIFASVATGGGQHKDQGEVTVQASRLVLVAALGFAALPLHCKKRDHATNDERAACASACAALVSAGCERQGLRTADQARCVEECAKRGVELAPAHCS